MMDEFVQKDFSHHMTQTENFQCRRNWWIPLNNDRTSGPLSNRSDFNEALSTLHHPHQESGERQHKQTLTTPRVGQTCDVHGLLYKQKNKTVGWLTLRTRAPLQTAAHREDNLRNSSLASPTNLTCARIDPDEFKFETGIKEPRVMAPYRS